MTGRSLYQFNAATMTSRTRNNELRPSDVLDISPADATELGFRDGEVARVVSRYGSALLPVHMNSQIVRGQLFATFQTPDIFVNALTGSHRDSAVGTPEYKLTAVRIERPLPVAPERTANQPRGSALDIPAGPSAG
jgi:formate dehydrogenase major subunit